MTNEKKTRLLLCIIILFLSTISCNAVSESITDIQTKGTNIGYSRCIEKNKAKGISDYVLSDLCCNKHSQLVYPQLDQSRAGYEFSYGTCRFKGHLINKSNDTIITSIAVSIYHQDNKNASGKVIEDSTSIENLWIEPGQYGSFETLNLQYTPDQNRINVDGKTLYSWDIKSIKGIKVMLY